jgi:hypothetical protein
MDATPIYGDAVLSGFMQSKDGMDYFYDPEGVFQGSQKSQKADTFWDTFGPMIMAAMTMGGGGAMLGNSLFGLTGQAAAGAGGALAGGVNAALTDQDILAGALKGGVSSAGAMKLGDTGITLGDVNKAINLAQNPNLAGAANLFAPSVGSTQIGDTGISLNDVLKGLNTVQALGSGNDKQIFDAVTGLAKTYGSSGVASSTEPAITTLSDEDLAELKLRNQPGELQAYQDGGVQGLADFRKDMRLLNSLTTSGRTGDDMGGNVTETTTETTTPTDTSGTTGADTTDLNSILDYIDSLGTDTAKDSGLSNQDILDMVNATDDTVVVKGGKPLDYLPTDNDFVPTKIDDKGEVVVTGGRPTDTTGLDEGPIIPTGGTGNDGLETVTVTGGTGNDSITGGTGNDTTGLDEGPIIPTGGDGLETVTVTGGAGNDTITGGGDSVTGGTGNDSVTGGTGNDTVEELVVTDKKCNPGYVYDEDLKQCVPIQTTEDTVTGGTGNDDIEELVVTDKKCQPGFVYDEDLKQCVPIVTTPVVNPPVVKPPVVKPPVVKPPVVIPTTTPVYTPSGYYGATETNEPVYAGGMSDFNLLATLQELLAEEPVKKDTKKSKDKTKMATGGHLDDLLAEQMTVDDLLKLLR